MECKKKMSGAGIYFRMTIKRMGKRPLYLCLFLLFPLSIIFLPKLNGAALEEQIAVGYVMEGALENQEEREEFLLRELDEMLSGTEEIRKTEGITAAGSTEEKEIFHYIRCADREDLKRRIVTGELSCGVLFDEAFGEKVIKQDYWECITLYLPEGMNVGGIVEEDLFRKIYQIYSADWYADLLAGQGYAIEAEEVLDKFSEYQEEGRVFAVEYQEMSEETSDIPGWEAEEKSFLVSPQGVLAFLALLAACLGAMDVSRDKKNGAGKGLAGQNTFFAVEAGVPVLGAILFLIAGTLLFKTGLINGREIEIYQIFRTVCGALLYGMVLWIFAIVCGRFLPEKWLAAVLPCYLLLSLLCTPVFFDAGRNLPIAGYLGKLFPITWYLKWYA